MNQYVTGALIRELREKQRMTQSELAQRLNVSDKTISKWETGKGYPDITLLEPIAKVLGVSITELLSGNTIHNRNVGANMLRSRFYVCPVCGNVIHSMGEAMLTCHGVQLTPAVAELSDEEHKVFVEMVEDDYFVQLKHEMTKEHYISFIAAVSSDRVNLVKLYPEGAGEARFPMRGVKRIYYYCNREGLYYVDVNRHIGGKNKSYDNSPEWREFEVP